MKWNYYQSHYCCFFTILSIESLIQSLLAKWDLGRKEFFFSNLIMRAGDRLFSDFEDCQEEMVVSGLSHFTAVEFLKSASGYSNHYCWSFWVNSRSKMEIWIFNFTTIIAASDYRNSNYFLKTQKWGYTSYRRIRQYSFTLRMWAFMWLIIWTALLSFSRKTDYN